MNEEQTRELEQRELQQQNMVLAADALERVSTILEVLVTHVEKLTNAVIELNDARGRGS